MSWRFSKRFKLGPVLLSLGKRGLGISTGIRGIRVGVTSLGRKYLSLSIPGTGLSWRKNLSRPPDDSSDDDDATKKP